MVGRHVLTPVAPRLALVASAGLLVLALVLPALALASVPPLPDSACASESSFKSTQGTTRASVTFINDTDETVQSLWLDYKGTRVFYSKIAPHSSYVQPTWLTHPWIVASLDGTCYRLVVMTSLKQTVTLDPGDGGAVIPPVTNAPPLETFPAARLPTPAASPEPAAAPTSTTTGDALPSVAVVGAALAVVAGVGALAVTGRLSGTAGKAVDPGSVRRPPPAPGAGSAIEQGVHGTKATVSDVIAQGMPALGDGVVAAGAGVGAAMTTENIGPMPDDSYEIVMGRGMDEADIDFDFGTAPQEAVSRGASAVGAGKDVMNLADALGPAVGGAQRANIPGGTAEQAIAAGQDNSTPDHIITREEHEAMFGPDE